MKLSKYIYLLFVGLVVFSCTDEDKFNNEVFFELERGGFVRFQETFNPLIGTNDASAFVYNPIMEDPNGNLIEYTLSVIDFNGDTAVVNTFTEAEIAGGFELGLTAENVAAAMGIQTSDFAFGQTLRFLGAATRNDGTVFTSGGLDVDFDEGTFIGNTQENLTDEPGYRDALDFNLIIACPNPPDASTYPGTYTVVSSGWFVEGAQVNVVAGPGADQVTIEDVPGRGGIAGTSGTFIITLNEDQTVSFPEAFGWTHATFGPLSFTQSATLNFTFECASNTIQIRKNGQVAAGTFGAVTSVFRRN